MHKKIVYEQPLNERVRTLLRLEFLFKQVRHSLRGESVWDSRAAVSSVLEIQSLFSRSDLKAELLKELERHASYLVRLGNSPGVDPQRLQSVLGELEDLGGQLQGVGGQFGAHIKDNEFLIAVRQRSAIPGGTCDFDLPLYHYWLQLPLEQRTHDLEHWLAGFEPANQAVTALLRLVRHSAGPSAERAVAGSFQKSLPSNLPAQMVRVAIPPGLPCYPEISGGKHRFSIRFLEHRGFDERPQAISEDLEFELVLCVI